MPTITFMKPKPEPPVAMVFSSNEMSLTWIRSRDSLEVGCV